MGISPSYGSIAEKGPLLTVEKSEHTDCKTGFNNNYIFVLIVL